VRGASGVVACPTTPEPQGHQQPAGPFSARNDDTD